MIMSQPVSMVDGEWKPNFDFPSPDEEVLKSIVSKVAELLIEYDLGKRFNINFRETTSFLTD